MLGSVEDGLAQVHIVDALQGLKRIRDKDAEAVLWDREVPRSISSFLGEVSSEPFKNGRFRLLARNIHACVLSHFRANEISLRPELDTFAQDVQSLADEISKLFSTTSLRLRLEAVTNDACRKFHADNVKARLICTYAGPGTEYGLVDNTAVPNDVHRVPTGQPILLKGLKWPAQQKSRLKHRSPPIEGTGQTRFVVVLEPTTPDTEQLNESYLPFPLNA